VTLRVLVRALAAWVIATIAACVIVRRVCALDMDTAHPRAVVASVWSGGALEARAVLAHAGDRDAVLDAALSSHPGTATLVYEAAVGEGPVLVHPEAALAASLVAGRDGLMVTLAGRTEYLTPDDLLSRQAYDGGIRVPSIGLVTGVDVPLALAMLADRFGQTASDLLEHARFRRVRFVRSLPGAPPARTVTADSMTDDDVREGVLAAAHFLARGVDAQGRFRYIVEAPTNRTLPGYDWPRHAGATYFLAQVAALSSDPEISWAALRAASWLRDNASIACGSYQCIGSGARVDLGSTALAVIAYVELARTDLDRGYALLVPGLTAFLRAQQRDDGEFMHEYDRTALAPVDVQLLYYSGEATLALSRAHSLLGDPRDLDAAARGLRHLTGPAWSFFGSRYYFGEEHWTCQALDDLWRRAPDARALDFCLRWQAYGRALQYAHGETSFDAEGAYGLGPFLTPRLTPVGSRAEAGIATLDAALRAGKTRDELSGLDRQMRRSLALLLRQQFRPGPRHLFADPAAVEGAMPGSEVDWDLRIDFAQHAGSAMVRWLALAASERPKH
jgi:hypothetical protein